MAYRISFSAEAEADFDTLFEHLVDSYMAFGESEPEAFDRASLRVQAIRRSAETLAMTPYRGTLQEALRPGLRQITLERAILYFRIDEATSTVRITAVFFGSQDHTRRMILRLLSRDEDLH